MRRAISLLTLLLGCSFDSSGIGGTDGGSATEGSAGSDSASSTSGASSASSASGPTTGDSATSSSSSGSTDPSTTTTTASSDTDPTVGPDVGGGGDACGPTLEVVVSKVEDALVTPPMETVMSQQGEGLVAYSPTAEEGVVLFTVSIPCSGTWYLWGRVNDQDPGTHGDDPDSFYVSPNGGPELTWFYGCDTEGGPEWSWAPVHNGMEGGSCDAVERLEMNLPAGIHTFKFRNREGQNFWGATAALARIALVNLPEYIPTNE